MTIFALALRVCSTGWTQLERDEAQCFGIVNDPNFLHWLSVLKTDGNAPLLHILIWPFVIGFGGQILPLKLLGLGIASALPAVAYWLFHKRLGETATLHYCFLLAVSPILIRNGELIRCYGLLHIGVLIITMTLMDFMTDPKSQFRKYVLLLTAALYLHLFSLTILAGHGLTMLIEFLQRRLTFKIFMIWASTVVLAFVLFSPWLTVVAWQIHQNLQPWQRHIAPFSLLALNLNNMFFDGFNVLATGPVLLLCWAMSIYGAGLKREKLSSFAWFCVLIGALLGSMFLHQLGMPYRDRYLSILVPISLLLFSCGSARASDFASRQSKAMRWIFLLAAVLPTILLVCSWFGDLQRLMTMPESSFANAYLDCKQQMNPKRDLIVVGMQCFAPESYRVLPHDLRIIAFPDSDPLQYVIWPGIDSRTKDENRMQKMNETMEQTLSKGGAIWLVDNLQPEVKLPPTDFMDLSRARANQIRTWLKTHASEVSDKIYPCREREARLTKFEPLTQNQSSGEEKVLKHND